MRVVCWFIAKQRDVSPLSATEMASFWVAWFKQHHLNVGNRGNNEHSTNRDDMLETIALILIVLWLLGMVSSYTMGGFIHILLVIAVIAIVLRLIRGKSV